MAESTLHWLDYLILAIFLAISLGIGVYHSLTGGKQKTTNEFIMANRALSVIPTALSMLVSFQSAIALLGFTSEIYSYGTQYMLWMNIAYALAILISGFIFVPWIYPLKLVSINEYFYLRFKSKLITAFAGCLSLSAAVLYMGVAMYAPSAALESVTGFPVALSIPLMAVVCIAYTTLGGMRAVIWTDVFQFFIMLGGILAIFIKGIIVIGGFDNVISLLSEQDRINWIVLTPDPRVRHTVWEFLIGGTMVWIFFYGLSQASAQRYNATSSIRQARLSMYLNIPVLALLACLLCLIGMIVTSYYISIECDPISSHQISNRNQLLPYFVTKLFSDTHGFSGLFLATLYGGALSTISSSLSGSAANCWKDILNWKFEKMQENRRALYTRVLVVVFGLVATGIAFLAAVVPGPMTQVSQSLTGSISGPYMGMFMLGGLFRKANWKGSLVGVICGLTISIWLSMGSFNTKDKHPPLHALPVSGCFMGNSTTRSPISNVYYHSSEEPVLNYFTEQSEIIEGDHNDGTDDILRNFYTISYLWFIVVGLITTVLTGLMASLFFGCVGEEEKIDDNLFISFKRVIGHSTNESEKYDKNICDEEESKSILLMKMNR